MANNLCFTLKLGDDLQDDIRDYMLNTVNSIQMHKEVNSFLELLSP